MRYLGLDVGTRRTGAAIADDHDGILFSLETIKHADFEILMERVLSIIAEKKIDQVAIGLPLLLSGVEGAQAGVVHAFAEKLATMGISYKFVDERMTTPAKPGLDKDSTAACSILSSILKS